MKISFKKSRFITTVASAALVATAVIAIPTTAQAADPQCATVKYVTQCAGASTDGAPFLMIAAAELQRNSIYLVPRNSSSYQYPSSACA